MGLQLLTHAPVFGGSWGSTLSWCCVRRQRPATHAAQIDAAPGNPVGTGLQGV